MRRTSRVDAGFTALETAVVATLVFLLILMALPRTLRAYETSRVAAGEAGLNTLWTAQRIYRLHHGTFADEISALTEIGLAPAGMAIGGGIWNYEVLTADHDSFRMRAVRRQDGGWSGVMNLREDGTITGGSSHVSGETVQP